ncbi:mechanosensitive ion channel family protein [Aestuariispira insulae]|uniref:Small-conductance mechanosensitive channel n=1 Tax=Aestuariispira insulae TaxID=1461337 RepID=A0A3D9HGL9_9PROT|nr:mechanosensitive ion channel family protein [Aestuariispira insulae]RED48638.1 small conductance mechanosensitive channel [Aestuariispira insulae]
MEKLQEIVPPGLLESGLDYAMQALIAILILIVGWTIAGWVKRLTLRAMNKIPNMDATLKPLLSNIAKYIVIIITIIAVLSEFGIETTSIIAVLGAAGLAIGLALQGTLQNIAAGVMILILRPLRVGDFVEAAGTSGVVKEIGLFTTQFTTLDGLFLSVPNSSIWGGMVKNYNMNQTRRVDLEVGISYDDNLTEALTLLETFLKSRDKMLADPAPAVMVMALADSSVNINLRCWVNTPDYWAFVCDLKRDVKVHLEANGFTIPYPQRDVYLHQVEKTS